MSGLIGIIMAAQSAEAQVPFDALEGVEGGRLGGAVAVRGAVAAAGAPDEMVQAQGGFDGAVYVYAWAIDHWALDAVLNPSLGGISKLGSSVDISGGLLVAGAPAHGPRGAVLVYRKIGGQWVQLSQLSPEGAVGFGASVAIADGAVVATDEAGFGWFFEEEEGTWTPVREVLCDAVSADGGVVACGVADSNTVTVHERDIDGFWGQTAAFGAPVPPGAEFGASVDVGGASDLIVGAPGIEEAFVYHRIDGNWVRVADLTHPDDTLGTDYGRNVSADDGTYVVAAPCIQGGCPAGTGQAFHYVPDWDGGLEVRELLPLPAPTGDIGFASDVSVHDGRTFVGAYTDDLGAPDGGAVYMYETPVDPFCSADLNEDDAVTGIDLANVLSSWGTIAPGHPQGFLDVNGDSHIGGYDLANLLATWGVCQ